MRSRMNCRVSSGQVHQWTLNWLLQAKLVEDHGWLCTAAVMLNIVLRAAARSISVSAACRDLSEDPSDSAVIVGLDEGIPKTLKVLERRLNESLTTELRRRSWQVAIDWHPAADTLLFVEIETDGIQNRFGRVLGCVGQLHFKLEAVACRQVGQV